MASDCIVTPAHVADSVLPPSAGSAREQATRIARLATAPAGCVHDRDAVLVFPAPAEDGPTVSNATATPSPPCQKEGPSRGSVQAASVQAEDQEVAHGDRRRVGGRRPRRVHVQ